MHPMAKPNLPKLLDQLAALVAEPSVSSTKAEFDQSNRRVIDLLAEWLEDLGFEIQIQAVDEVNQKFNLIARFKQIHAPDNAGLVLSGHTDTVPYDAHLWDSDPLLLTEKDNQLYGLGTCDMKGFFALCLQALVDLDLNTLNQPLTLLATCDEESTMSGARILEQQFGQFAVIGEPTGLKPIRLHKGIMMEAIRVQGKAAHSSNPALGHNALEALHGVMTEILAFRQSLAERYQNPYFDVAIPTLNLGCLHAGDNPNRICSQGELQFDLRPIPGMDINALREEIRKRLLPLEKPYGVTFEFITLSDGIPPFETAADAKLVKLTESLTQTEAGAVCFATEGPFLQRLGMETVIMGPGSIDQAHQPNEFLALDQIKPGIAALQGLIHQLCIVERVESKKADPSKTSRDQHG